MSMTRTEAGMGGRLGRSHMTHWDLGHVVKRNARKARRVNDTWAAYESVGVFTFDGPIVTFEPALDSDIVSYLDVDEPECTSYADLLYGLESEDREEDDEPMSSPYGEEVLELDRFTANNGFIITQGKWYC